MSDNFFHHVQKAYRALKSAEAGPSDADKEKAIQIDLWLPARNRFGALVLWGQVVDHPELGTDDILTTPLVSLDISGKIARSCSRWYRLGEPFFRFAAELQDQVTDEIGESTRFMVEFPGVHPVEDEVIAQALIARFTDHFRVRARELGLDTAVSGT